jgi:hypothetical protein
MVSFLFTFYNLSYTPATLGVKSWVELSLPYGRQSVDQFVLVSGSPLGPMTRFCPYPFFSDNCFVVVPVGCPLWREDGSVTYSAIADWSGHWEPITIHYRLIWDCVPLSSPLTTRRDYSGGILTRLHTGGWCIRSRREITSGSKRTKKVQYHWSRWRSEVSAWQQWLHLDAIGSSALQVTTIFSKMRYEKVRCQLKLPPPPPHSRYMITQ